MKAKHFLLFLTIVLPLSLTTIAFASDTADVQAILSAENHWNDLYKAGDFAGLGNLLADDFIITIEDGTRYGKSGYIGVVANPSIKIQVSEFTDLKVRVNGDVGVVTGGYRVKGTNDGKPFEYRDHFTDVWQKRGGKWVIMASHYSPSQKS